MNCNWGYKPYLSTMGLQFIGLITPVTHLFSDIYRGYKSEFVTSTKKNTLHPLQILEDNDGESYLDFTAGIAVNCLGHSDQGWAETVAKQAGKLCHTSNLYLHLGGKNARKKLHPKKGCILYTLYIFLYIYVFTYTYVFTYIHIHVYIYIYVKLNCGGELKKSRMKCQKYAW